MLRVNFFFVFSDEIVLRSGCGTSASRWCGCQGRKTLGFAQQEGEAS